MTLQVLRETFRADRLTRELVETVRARGAEIAYRAIQTKAALGDRDVRIEVDGSGRQIDQWKRKIRLSWGGTSQLAELIDFVYANVVRNTPRASGALAGAWVWFLNKKEIAFGSTSGATLVKNISLGEGDELSLVNMKPYIRRAEWGFVSRKTALAKGRAVKRNRILREAFKARGITKTVAAAARTRFRGFSIADPWFEIPGHVLSKRARDQRIPTVTIRRSKKTLSFGA